MAAAAVVIAVPGRPSGRPALTRPAAGLRAQDAAYVLNRAAAAQVNSYRMISVDQYVGGLVYTDVATQQHCPAGIHNVHPRMDAPQLVTERGVERRQCGCAERIPAELGG